MKRRILFIAILLSTLSVKLNAQGIVAFCNVPIDSTSMDTLIQKAMVYGTAQDVINTIDSAKDVIDTAVGCGRSSYNYFPAYYSKPTLVQVSSDWYGYNYKKMDSLVTTCPGAGRNTASVGLAGYYARRVPGYSIGLDTLNYVAQDFLQTQYDATHAPTPLIAPVGVYGYLDVSSTDSCYVTDISDNDILNHRTSLYAYGAVYSSGAYSGDSFFVRDYDTSIFYYWGGLAYDQAWTTAMMIQAAINQPNPADKIAYTNSANESAQWAMQEPNEVISEITASNIWTLAEMYDWTGNKAYLSNMMDKLHRGLLPSILTDFIKAGYVDGMKNKPFDSLTQLARVPGRIWDPGDATVWNTARCANALVEAYVALRDQGDKTTADSLKPYVEAMMSNICSQIDSFGVFALSTQYRDIDYTIINAVWKIELYENDPHPAWDSAAWAMYDGAVGLDNGIGRHYGPATVDVALYLMVLYGIPYQPLFEGIEPVINNVANAKIYPNPSDGNSVLQFYNNKTGNIYVRITDITGKTIATIASRQFDEGIQTINLNYNAISNGIYLVWLKSDSQNKVIKWVKNQ